MLFSDWLEVEIFNEGKIYKQRYERGKEHLETGSHRRMRSDKTGTKVTFFPDDDYFEETVFDYDILKQRFREMAFSPRG